MKTNRKNLISILQAVRPGLASKDIIEQSTAFLFADGRVLTYNDDVAVSHPLKDLEINGAVQSKELFSLLNKMPDEEIEFEVVGGELIVKGKGRKSGIRLSEAKNLAEISGVLGKPKDWYGIPDGFLAAIRFSLFSAGKDMTKAMQTCIHCEGNTTLSTDGNRISGYYMAKGVNMPAINIPARSAKEISSYKPVEYALTTGWIHLAAADDVIFSCRTMVGDYPTKTAWGHIDGAKGELAKLPEGLQDALERAGIFTAGVSNTDDRICLTLEDGLLTVRGEGPSGWFEETARVRYRGEYMRFEINPDFLREILTHSDEVTIGEKLLKFEGEQFVHVVRTLTAKPVTGKK